MRGKRSSKLLKTAISLFCAILFLTASSCYYEPVFYPVRDVLKPGPEVEILGYTEDGNAIVNKEFMLWVESLKDEVKRLRRELSEERRDG